MSQIPPEPIKSHTMHGVGHHASAPHHSPVNRGSSVEPTRSAVRPANVESLVAIVQADFPAAAIQITGRGRTVQRQAELMAERILKNRAQFLSTYYPAPHISEMDGWVSGHPGATQPDTTAAFVDIITRARQHGAVVSNHLSDHARDISIPRGGVDVQLQVRRRLHELGGHVIDEHDAVGGPHWHVDY